MKAQQTCINYSNTLKTYFGVCRIYESEGCTFSWTCKGNVDRRTGAPCHTRASGGSLSVSCACINDHTRGTRACSSGSCLKKIDHFNKCNTFSTVLWFKTNNILTINQKLH